LEALRNDQEVDKEMMITDYCLEDGLGHVTLIKHSGSDVDVVNSARVSFGKAIKELGENDIKLIRYLIENEHGSPMEHNSLTFLVKCPIFVARQWHRHRIGISINEISARYTEVKEEFYIPKYFRAQATNNRQASIEAPELDHDELRKVVIDSINDSYDRYWQLLESGVAREQARMVLPNAMYTEFYWTCNLRSLLHFIKLRRDSHAQWEIRQYAESMLKQASEHFPHTIHIFTQLIQT